jgi:hypothetical protein
MDRGSAKGIALAPARPLRSLRLAPPPKLLGEVGVGPDRGSTNGITLAPARALTRLVTSPPSPASGRGYRRRTCLRRAPEPAPRVPGPR